MQALLSPPDSVHRKIKTPDSRPDSGVFSQELRYEHNTSNRQLENFGQGVISSPMNSVYSDHYIDDEIPDNSNLFMNQFVSYTDLLVSQDLHFNTGLKQQDCNDNKTLGVHPTNCKVTGAGAYYGQVGVTNTFQVCMLTVIFN